MCANITGTLLYRPPAESPGFMKAQNERPLSHGAVTVLQTTMFQASSVSWKLGSECFGSGTACTAGVGEVCSLL